LVPPALRIIRKSSFTPKPWKNGGGVTDEVIRVPADGDTFEWRVSVAHIDVSGPFSDFASYHRTMVLLQGDGVELEFSDGSRRSLLRVGDLAEFDGGLPTYCRLLGGPCVDLNLMVAKSLEAKVSVQHLTARGLNASASSVESTLIFSLDAAIMVRTDGTQPMLLEPWDLGIISDCSVRVTLKEGLRVSRQESGASPNPGATSNLSASANPSAVFFATISH
jgi:environmental stress-induced protein Ves